MNMKNKLLLIAVLVGTMSVLGCGDDETGTGGTGASAGTDVSGGSGATGGSYSSLVCVGGGA